MLQRGDRRSGPLTGTGGRPLWTDRWRYQHHGLEEDITTQLFTSVLPAVDEVRLELHEACIYGRLPDIQLLVQSGLWWIDCSDSRGRRPLHVVLSLRSVPNTSACLRYLLEHGANVNRLTHSGQTPLHVAASEGLLDCAEILVEAGADVLVQDSAGHTPLDLARIWCHRKTARYLKSCKWQVDKTEEMEERELVHVLYGDLVDLAKQNSLDTTTLVDEKMAEWANRKHLPPLKGLPHRVQVSRFHTRCFLSDQSSSKPDQQPGRPQEDGSTSRKQPAASPCRPWTIFMGLQPEKAPAVPDLRGSVALWRDGSSKRPQYSTQWDSTPRPAPNLPMDILQRVLFPRDFPSRIASPRHFQPQDIVEVKHRGGPRGRSTSPWTEVAMHLAEDLQPGHY
ncbi:ankyrin repeat domain-containing protein 53 isoform X2 [Brachyistius frenatus]